MCDTMPLVQIPFSRMGLGRVVRAPNTTVGGNVVCEILALGFAAVCVSVSVCVYLSVCLSILFIWSDMRKYAQAAG